MKDSDYNLFSGYSLFMGYFLAKYCTNKTRNLIGIKKAINGSVIFSEKATNRLSLIAINYVNNNCSKEEAENYTKLFTPQRAEADGFLVRVPTGWKLSEELENEFFSICVEMGDTYLRVFKVAVESVARLAKKTK